MLLNFTKGGCEVSLDHPTLLIIHLLDHILHAEGFMVHYGELDTIPPTVCRNEAYSLDTHEHVIRRPQLREGSTEFQVWSAYETELHGQEEETLWTRDSWRVRIYSTGGVWKVELGCLHHDYESLDRLPAFVHLRLPDYNPDSLDLGILEGSGKQGVVRTTAWERLIKDSECLPE